jgi:hypothetical protein
MEAFEIQMCGTCLILTGKVGGFYWWGGEGAST